MEWKGVSYSVGYLYTIIGDSIKTWVSVHYIPGVRNFGMSVKRGCIAAIMCEFKRGGANELIMKIVAKRTALTISEI